MQVLVCSGVINLSSPFKSASFLIINRKPRAAIIKMLKWPAKQPAIIIHTVSSQQSSFPGCVPPILGSQSRKENEVPHKVDSVPEQGWRKRGKEERKSSVCNSLIITPWKPSIKAGILGDRPRINDWSHRE